LATARRLGVVGAGVAVGAMGAGVFVGATTVGSGVVLAATASVNSTQSRSK
jgi:hypothetical protein